MNKSISFPKVILTILFILLYIGSTIYIYPGKESWTFFGVWLTTFFFMGVFPLLILLSSLLNQLVGRGAGPLFLTNQKKGRYILNEILWLFVIVPSVIVLVGFVFIIYARFFAFG